MKTTALVASTLVAVVAISMMVAPVLAAGSYTLVKNFKVGKLSSNTEGYALSTTAPIPKTADAYISSQLVFGYAWLDTTSSPIKAVVATLHPGFNDSTFATGDKWHAHTATIVSTTTPSGDSILCLASIASPDFKLGIAGAGLVQALRSSDATVTTADAATSFVLQINGDCPGVEVPLNGTPTILNLQVVAPAP